MGKHVQLVAILHIGLGILGLMVAGMVFFILMGIGIIAEDPEAMTVLSIVGIFIAAMCGLTSIPSIIGGIGLLKRRAWSKIVLVIVSIFNLLNIPIGTALAVYTLWVMLQDETGQLLSPSMKTDQ